MTVEYVTTALLLTLISSIAFTVIIYWHITTKGTWRHWPAGQSLMGLLVIIAVGFGVGALNRLLGNYPAKDFILILLYTAFAAALSVIGLTIRKEMRAGKRRLRRKAHPATGPVIIAVATTNEETDDD